MADEQRRQEAEQIVENLKQAVKKGNIARILVKKGESTFLNIPLNAGLAGTILGLAAAPWALITAALVTLGLDCTVELVKTDGQSVELLSRELGRKAAAVGGQLVGEVRSSIRKEQSGEEDDRTAEAVEEQAD